MSYMRRLLGIPKTKKGRVDKKTAFGRQIVHKSVERLDPMTGKPMPITHVDILHATNGWRRIRVLDPGKRRRLIGI